MKRHLMGLAAAALLLSACSDAGDSQPSSDQVQAACTQEASDRMKDPDSTVFRGVHVGPPTETTRNFRLEDGTNQMDVPGRYWIVNGEMNAANSYGAMVGFTEFSCEVGLFEGRDMSVNYVKMD